MKHHHCTGTALLCAAALLSAPCAAAAATPEAQDASVFTRVAQQSVAHALHLNDQRSFTDARRGFIAPLPDGGLIRDAAGHPVWNPAAYAFLKQAKAPDTVNPSLWRQSRLVMEGGLFQVTDRLYQVRNADLSNMTIVEGATGLIIIDPLISSECAAAALDLYYRHRPRKPVVAVLYSHSHVDHYGGVCGVVRPEDVAAGKVRVIAPEGFMHAVGVENVMAGVIMGRRAAFMYGSLLPAGPKGHVGAGLGLTTSRGSVSLIPPTETVNATGQKLVIDGLTFEFMLAQNSEAPSEMHWYIEELKAVSAAENCVQSLHNLYTPRGAKARDPLLWSKYLDETLTRWGDTAEVMYGMHHWPVWGGKNIRTQLELSRDGYRYMNDRTLHLANQGLNKEEIAAQFTLPEAVNNCWAMRGYYGNVENNVKGTYTYYLGWFDGNPLRMRDLPPAEEGKKYVEYMGGADAVLSRARRSFDAGEYRWTAQVLGHVIAADPHNMQARNLAAAALEQLGYQEENAPRRNFYLSGAQELRGTPLPPMPASSAVAGTMTPDMLFDYLGVLLDADKAAKKTTLVNVRLVDSGDVYALWLSNSVLNHRKLTREAPADATLAVEPATLIGLAQGKLSFAQAKQSGKLRCKGSETKVRELLACFAPFAGDFPLTLPVVVTAP